MLAGAWAGPVARAVDGAPELESVARSTYLVREGDTLWSIARHVTLGEDPRPLVDAISAANGVEAGALVPGQTLVIPAAT
jgi:nucleoid-associated protein YgaU